jgi:hypothetical protein
MIDMSALYGHDEYQDALDIFNASSCKWSSFINVHTKVSKNKCPICESPLDGSATRISNSGNALTIHATIDHYRPQKHYNFLKCNHKNYLLMCSECNNIYKGSEFPLHTSTPTRATNKDEIESEKPLIVNPIHDDLLELFVLVFKRSAAGGVLLELKPKASTGYLYKKALETIKLFGLGDCETNRHSNNNVHSCRISILQSHYNIFYTFAKALKDGDKFKASLELKTKRGRFENYGFFEFIKKNQFEILV